MPTSENSDSTAGRVTRSLRKRLTSIDSDASSRPGTPVINNLQTISETETPSKRITRRTSLSTPAATPSKVKTRLETVETANSPARRLTRRRSLSVQDHELTVQIKSKELSINSVKEEENTPEMKNKRVTRSSSKSPLESLTGQSKLDITKASAKKLLQKSTEQEEAIINSEYSNGTAPTISPTANNKKQTKVMLKKEKTIDEMIVDQVSPFNRTETNSTQMKDTSIHKEKAIETQLTPSKGPIERKTPRKDSNDKNPVTIKHFSPAKKQAEQSTPRKSGSAQKQNKKNNSESSLIVSLIELKTPQKDLSMKNCVSVQLLSSAKEKVAESSPRKNISLGKKDIMDVTQLSPSKAQLEEDSPQKKKSRPEKLKNVAFDETADEDKIKNVFPKTPGLTKSKSYILDSSKDTEKEASHKSTDNLRQSIDEADKKSDKEDRGDEDPEVQTTKTPYKLKLKAVESSTPIQGASPKKNKTPAIEERNMELIKENKEADAEVPFPKSWTHSVSGTVSETAKIDSIKSEESMRKKLEEEEALKKTDSIRSQNQSRNKRPFDDSECDDDMLEEDDSYDEQEEEEEERSREQTIFVDDEAMEVPEGEESMDSEERAYLEENEVPIYGESIGSEDSEDDDDDYEEEADEEDNAFIVSDSEDVLHADVESDSNDEVDKESKGKGKKYKRIVKYSESSNEEEKSKDFCLILDSSAEEKNTKENLNSSNQDAQEKNNDGETLSRAETSETAKDHTANSIESLKSKDDNAKTGDTAKTTKVSTPNVREKKKEDTIKIKSLRNEADTEKEEMASLVDTILNTNKTMSLQNTEGGEKETEVGEDDKKVTKKSPKKSSSKFEVDSEPNIDSKVKNKEVSKSERKSQKSTLREDISNVKMEEDAEVQITKSPKKLRKSLSKSKLEISQSEVEESVLNSSNRKSISDEQQKEKNTATSPNDVVKIPTSEKEDDTMNASRKEARKFLKISNNGEEGESPEEDQNSSKSNSKKILKGDNAVADQRASVDLPEKDKNTSLKQARKSFNNPADDKVMSRKSVNNSNADKTVVEDEEKSSGKKSLNVSRKSLNDSKKEKRKSFIRTSTEETNAEEEQHSVHSRSLNSSKFEKSSQSYDDGSEPEETLSASEGRSLNSSRRSRKSLNQSRMSLENVDEARISRKRPFQDNEEELEEAGLNKPQRESVSHNKSQYQGSENSASEAEVDDDEKVSQNDDDDDDEGDDACFSDAEEENHQKYAAERSTMMEFLGEEESQPPPQSNLNSSRRKSMNKSKLDETFELNSKGNSTSMHESLHQSIIRKSLNQSQLRREAGKENRNDTESEENGASSDDLTDSSMEEEVKVVKKILPERGLSVSLSNIEIKKKKIKGDEKAIRNSFTIGVSVRKTPSSDKVTSSPSSDAAESESDHPISNSEQEDLEKVKNVQRVGPYKPGKSLSTSLKPLSPLNPEATRTQKRIKRTSLYMQDQDVSKSFVENLAEEKKKVESKRKRKSNSFCAVTAPSIENEVEHKMPQSERKQKSSLESEQKTDIKRILSRCDEILEAANLAKREAKLNAKKSKVKKPKWMDKEGKTNKEDNEVQIPLVSRKEIKRKEKIKKELAKAIKHSTAMLKTIDLKLSKKLKTSKIIETEDTADDNPPSSSKRLPTEFLQALDESTAVKKKKSKEIETTPPSDKENVKRSSNKATYTISDIAGEKKKKKHDREILQTATGTVVVEPSTPVKLRYQHGFRESPKTPVGFKIQDIYSAGRNEKEKPSKHGKKLFTASGEFIEEDLSIPNTKENSKREKSQKRKRRIEEPIYSLPKTQWTPSGVFVEEDLYTARPLANSTATQFMVTSLYGAKNKKTSSKVVSSTTLSNALRFKQNALFSDKVRRETSRELIHRKQRKLANNQY